MDLTKKFSTTGFNILYEWCETFGCDISLKIVTETSSILEKENDHVSENIKFFVI